jgi:hypothetical protein
MIYDIGYDRASGSPRLGSLVAKKSFRGPRRVELRIEIRTTHHNTKEHKQPFTMSMKATMKAINGAAKALNQYIDSATTYLKANAFPILALLGAYYVYKTYCTYYVQFSRIFSFCRR